ncbi:MAG: alpha/beta hydrolase [Candidatus Lokiarchaeota archaeon]|nr:alpha/beta hydrolase [Candidatus Lokiarchaeota archaeon]
MELLQKLEEHFIEVNGVKLHTIIVGSGKPIVLLHGFPEFWYTWRTVIDGLKDSYKLIVPDLRGYNLSDKPQGVENYTYDVIVEDIKQLSEKLNLGKFTLVGHDWGGFISWAFAELHPELLDRVIILNAANPAIFLKHLLNNPAQQKASAYTYEMASPEGASNLLKDDCEMLKKTVFYLAANKEGYTEFDKEQYVKAWTQPGAMRASSLYYRANQKNFNKLTGIINIPTMVIWAMKDIFMLPELLDELPDYVKDLKVIRVENSTHWIMNDNPEVVVSSIRNYLLK